MSKELDWLSLENFFNNLMSDWFANNYEDNGYTTRSREGVFSPALTMWLMLLQRLQQRRSLSGALEMLAQGHANTIMSKNTHSKKVKRGDISTNTGGLTKARQKLSLQKVLSAAEFISAELDQQSKGKGLWRGRTAYFIDGTTITLSRTASILESYPSNLCGKRDAHYPQLRCLCLHNVVSGTAISPCYGAYQGESLKSEQALAKEMLLRHKNPSIIIGDRNFGIFSMAYHASTNRHEVLFRLKAEQANKILGRCVGNKDIDEWVTWIATKHTCTNNPEIPIGAEIKGRLIRKRIEMHGFQPIELFFFTTCQEPVHLLVELYKKREHIENDIRSLKYTIGMEMLYSNTPEMVEKELVLGVVAYNLVRACLAKAAKILNIEPRKISFSRGAELTRIFGVKIRDAETDKEKKLLVLRYVTAIGQSKLPNRSNTRSEPRKLVRKIIRYPVMKNSRKIEQSIMKNILNTNT